MTSRASAAHGPAVAEVLLIGCTGAASSVPIDGSYLLLPGVLHAYTVSADELGNYTPPIPEPGTWALLIAGLFSVGAAARLRRVP